MEQNKFNKDVETAVFCVLYTGFLMPFVYKALNVSEILMKINKIIS